jgi:hypothetical protein
VIVGSSRRVAIGGQMLVGRLTAWIDTHVTGLCAGALGQWSRNLRLDNKGAVIRTSSKVVGNGASNTQAVIGGLTHRSRRDV